MTRSWCLRLSLAARPDHKAATAETIIEGGWLRSGDLGYLRPDGRLVVAGGRLRDMIIRGGENIYPVEVENLLRQHPAIMELELIEPSLYLSYDDESPNRFADAIEAML